MSALPPPGPTPPRPTRGPDFIASNLQFGKIGNGDELAIGFMFDDSEGNECLVVLHNRFGVLTPELAEILGKIIGDVTPGEEVAPVVLCQGNCGRRIFGDYAEAGFCAECGPKPTAQSSTEWCGPDDCPASICGGPHVSHTHENGEVITALPGAPCPFVDCTPL